MAIRTEGPRNAAYLVGEANGFRSRDEVTINVPAETTIPAGTVLGKVTSSGKFAPQAADSTDGSEEASAVLMYHAVNDGESAADVDVTATTRDAEVRAADLFYEAGADDAAKQTVNDALAERGIIVRK